MVYNYLCICQPRTRAHRLCSRAVHPPNKIAKIIINLKKPLNIKKARIKKNSKDKISCNMTKKQYYNVVDKLKKYINDGDVIQAVPSLRFKKRFKESPFSLYRSLRKLNPSPFLFILNFSIFEIGEGKFSIFGSGKSTNYTNICIVLQQKSHPRCASKPLKFPFGNTIIWKNRAACA